MRKELIGEIILRLGVSLFVCGAIFYVIKLISPEHIFVFAALALIFVGVGSSTKKQVGG